MVNTFVVYVFVVVHINHKKHMLVVKVVHVFFVVYINHKKHMKEANVVYVLHNKHVVGAFVVYVFLVVPCKPHVPPPCVFCGFTHTTFPSTTQTTKTHKPHLPRPCKPRFLHEPLFVPPYVFSSSMWFLFHMCFKRSVKNT